jgi:hypothetical protein
MGETCTPCLELTGSQIAWKFAHTARYYNYVYNHAHLPWIGHLAIVLRDESIGTRTAIAYIVILLRNIEFAAARGEVTLLTGHSNDHYIQTICPI